MTKRILITGAAGFIGFHLALHLKKRGDFVIGLDNFNDYYDPQLKKEREKILHTEGIEVLHADICDTDLLQLALLRHGITHVAHLAAQAGVRHSLIAPDDYVASNLHGFVSVLEACRRNQGVELVYASSSSVYGLNRKTPFSVDDKTDQPANLYGATKKANEAMAYAYHHLYGLRATGLRYFTVYGPWGRPDMAYYHFAEQIKSGKPIRLFHQGKMRRDFTYIDDIIQGTVAAIDLGKGYEIFNLGNHRPVEVLCLIELIEMHLKKKAVCEMLPMQPGEVLETCADIEASKEKLHFAPTISFEEGMARFMKWFATQKGSTKSS